MVHVAHGRLNVRVAHVGLDIRQRERLHGERPECMAEVVDSKLLEPGAPERRDVAPPQGGALDVELVAQRPGSLHEREDGAVEVVAHEAVLS